MKSIKRINLTGSAHNVQDLLGPSTRALSPRGIRVALLAAMVLVGMALWSTPADGQEAAEPVWSADMTVVEYSSVSMGAASADLFSNVGGSGNLQIKSLWSHIPGRDLRLAFQEGVPNASDYTLQVGGLSLEFPAGSSGDSNFKWNDVDVQWQDGQVIHVRIVPTAEIEAQPANTPATGVPTISGTAQVGETLTADTSGIGDADGLTNVSYAYQWIRTDGGTDTDIADATDSIYTLTDDDQGKTIKLKVTFNDDKGNSETLAIVAAADVGENEQKPQFLVSNLGVNVATGIMRPLGAARSGFAQAFTTGAKTDGYALGSVGIHVSQFSDGSAVGDHLQVTINGVASEGEPGDAHCTLTNPSSFSTPGVIAFEAPTGVGSCPQLATETTYFVVIEWVNPSGTDSFALIPQTYPSEETAATEEDPGGAEGWSIADKSYYLAVSSDARTWTAYDETASFKIEVKEASVTAAKANTPATGAPTISGTPQVGETLTASTSDIADTDELTNVSYSYQWTAGGADIDGATGSSYTLTSSEQEQTVQVRVTFNDDAGNAESLTSAATGEVEARPNNPATGALAISGTPQVGETLTASTSDIADTDELTNVSYSYQWIAGGADISGATGSSHTLTSSEQGQTITVRVTFTDDANNAETLTSEATEAVAAAAPAPLTASILAAPSSHDGDNSFTFELRFSEEVELSYVTLRDDDAFSVTDGEVTGASRLDKPSNLRWQIVVEPDSDADVTIVLPPTTDCGAQGAICTGGGKKLSGRVELTVNGPEQQSQERQNNSATGAPAISGTPQVGETLTASTSGIDDEDGLTNVSYRYQWIAGGSDIDGATGSSYTLTSSEDGQTVQVRVAFTDDAGNTESLTSEATVAVAAKTNSEPTGLPTISGTPQVEQTLTADTSAIADEDGLTNVSYSYQWMAGGSDIDGATGSSYTLTSSEQGQTVQVRVTFTDDADNAESLTSQATVAVAAKPNSEPTGLPTITGTPQVDQTLTAGTSAIADEDGLTNVSYRYQWIRIDNGADTDIAGENDSTYTLVLADLGKTIKVKVSFTDDADNEETLTSVATVAVAAAPNRPATGAPTISGTPQVGETLTADTANIADDDGLTNVSYSYQWIRSDNGADSDLAGENNSTYTLVFADQGKTIKVKVSFTDDDDNEETLTSVATVAVAAAPNREATGAPTIIGTPQVDETLTVDTSPIDDQDGLTNVSYRYRWIAGGSDIDGATGSSYTLTSSEQGQTIQVRVTFTDDRDNAETLTSAATVEVAAAPEPLTVRLKVAASTSHDGSSEFTFEIEFSEEFNLSYTTLKFDAFIVTGGEVLKAQRTDKPSNIPWRITVRPDSNEDVTIILPVTENCDAEGAICTGDGRKLSNRLELTVSGPTE